MMTLKAVTGIRMTPSMLTCAILISSFRQPNAFVNLRLLLRPLGISLFPFFFFLYCLQNHFTRLLFMVLPQLFHFF
jgi:hypothetical protein